MTVTIDYPIWLSLISVTMFIAGVQLEYSDKYENLGQFIGSFGGLGIFASVFMWLAYFEVPGFTL